MSRTTKPKRHAPDRKQLRIALRLYDWSEWCRQVIRGVQRYAIECKDWRIFVAAGPPGMTRILRDGVVWDGIITGVLQDVRGYQRALKTHNTKVVAISAAIPHALRHLPRAAIDDNKVAASIGRHLLSGGFRHLAYSGAIGAKGSDARWDAMRAFASGANCDLQRFGDFLRKRRPTPALLAKWIKQLPKPVGITSWNMDEARQVVEACVRQKLNVPEQAAVVAWDDDEIIAETLEPTIS
ncbi:MAG: substrate-binding domain-containing protein, partial [Burkholderiales bacterium]|nr:substrate-binding domain-containing protein [Phycisphaerae bacterium]